jgi:cytoplasmic tRNA 2-thiolation protein 2
VQYGEIRTDSAQDRLQEYLQSLPTQTSRVDGINLLKRRLIERTARSLGATHVLFGRTLTSLSAALLSNICTGRGFNILDEFRSNCDGITSFNPLKELGSKECGAYAWWNGVPVLSFPIRRASSQSGGASISQLTDCESESTK